MLSDQEDPTTASLLLSGENAIALVPNSISSNEGGWSSEPGNARAHTRRVAGNVCTSMIHKRMYYGVQEKNGSPVANIFRLQPFAATIMVPSGEYTIFWLVATREWTGCKWSEPAHNRKGKG